MGTARVLEKERKECSLHALVKKKKKKEERERESEREREREGSLMTLLLCETLLWLRISFGSQQNVFTVRENSAKRTVGLGGGGRGGGRDGLMLLYGI